MALKDTLKALFVTGYKITQLNYSDWIDGILWKTDPITAMGPINVNGNPMQNVDGMYFAVSGGTLTTEGQLTWDAENHCPQYRPDAADVNIQVGQETYVRVLNNSGAIIPNGAAVYMNGAGQGTTRYRPTVLLASASAENKSYVLGVATHQIEIGQEGMVTVRGIVNDVNTQAVPAGSLLYLGVAPGTWSGNELVPPSHNVVVGRCIYSQTNNGSIYVSANIGHEIEELHNVKFTNLQNKDVLQYDAGQQLWVNKAVSAL
jgi:hypothetical protein